MKKTLWKALFLFCVMLVLTPSVAFAEGTNDMEVSPDFEIGQTEEPTEIIYDGTDKLESGNDLLLRAFLGEDSIQTRGVIGAVPSYNNLNHYQQWLYTELRNWINGINMNDIDQSTICTVQMVSVAEARALWENAVGYDNFDAVINCLISDLPSDFYWYSRYCSMNWAGQEITFKFRVASEYRAGGNEYAVSGAQIRRAHDAIEAVVDSVLYVKNLTDYEKLVHYRDLICSLVDYNHEAANGNHNSAITDPWQFVYVFDGDPETKVVCEGYSKSFQLLCDLTDWEDPSICCFTVSGTMDGNGHMWNIVQIQGQNYLVDVTNCDKDSVGYPDKLFLVGGRGDVNSGYYPVSADSYVSRIFYAYECDFVSTSILRLSGSNYTPPVQLQGSIQILDAADDSPLDTRVTYTPGKTLKVQYNRASGEPDNCLSFQWYLDGYAVPNETSPTFLLTGDEIGHTISVRVTMHDNSLTSAPVTIVEASGPHGTVSVSATFPSEPDGTTYTIGGETVTLHVTPDTGYKLSVIQVITTDGTAVPLSKSGNDYSFTMPTSDVSVQVKFVRS